MNFPASLLPSGDYAFYFAVDTEMDGLLSLEQLYFDVSDFICGEPDEDEAGEQSKKAANLDPDDPLNWQSVAERSKGVLGWAMYFMVNKCNIDTTLLTDAAQNIAEPPFNAYRDVIVNVRTTHAGTVVTTKTLPEIIHQSEFPVIDDEEVQWHFPLEDGAHALIYSTVPPILHVIRWEEWMIDKTIKLDD